MSMRWNEHEPNADGGSNRPDLQSASPGTGTRGPTANGVTAEPLPDSVLDSMSETAREAGLSPWNDAALAGVVGYTMYDVPTSEDGTITVVLPRQTIGSTPAQSLVRIMSQDDRTYLGVVVAGPFSEPDGLRGDSSLIVTTSVRSRPFQPQFHGRIKVELLGSEVGGTLQPPRFRPLPNSAVYVLDDDETAQVLQVNGDLRLGQAVGHHNVSVGIPSDSKAVLPRHLGIVGTTGGGKSTTVAGLVDEAQRSGLAVILLDVEGEYTRINEATTDQRMVSLLEQAGEQPHGVRNTTVYRLTGRETTNEDHPNIRDFSLRFSALSPFTVAEILDLNEAQQERFATAYDIAIAFAAEGKLGGQRINPLELDEFETGCPGVTLDVIMDIVDACISRANKSDGDDWAGRGRTAIARDPTLAARVAERKPTSAVSWRAVQSRLSRLARLKVFDRPGAGLALNADEMLRPGTVHIVDLSDIEAADVRNIVIADLLRSIQAAQDRRYDAYERSGDPAARPRTLVIIEEAHEFLAKNRVAAMPVLFGQIEKIAKRGRKRWLGLVFVTQMPQHLAPQVTALINNWIMHKLADPTAVNDLRQAVGGVDDNLWKQVRTLSPGQAIVACGHMTRPVLTAINPSAAQLRMVD